MTYLKKSNVFVSVLLGIIFCATVTVSVRTSDCPLTPQTAHKIKTHSAVYYITRNCTKRPFVNEISYFAYFQSWKDVRTTLDSILLAIPEDVRGHMKVKGEKSTTIPSTNIKKEDKPIIPETETPAIKFDLETGKKESGSEVIVKKDVGIPADAKKIEPITELNISSVIKDFLLCPTETEQKIFETDFKITWRDEWGLHPFVCDYQNAKPSRASIYSTIRILKDFSFSKPLPFTRGKRLYEYLTEKKLTVIPSLDCSVYSSGGNSGINLGGTFSRLHAVKSGSKNCDVLIGSTDTLDGFVYNPLYKAGTFVHEAHHAIELSKHDGKNGGDKNIDGSSAWAAQFYFYAWVNLYGENIDTATKVLAKNAAADILRSRFSENKCPADAELKKIVNEMVSDICS